MASFRDDCPEYISEDRPADVSPGLEAIEDFQPSANDVARTLYFYPIEAYLYSQAQYEQRYRRTAALRVHFRNPPLPEAVPTPAEGIRPFALLKRAPAAAQQPAAGNCALLHRAISRWPAGLSGAGGCLPMFTNHVRVLWGGGGVGGGGVAASFVHSPFSPPALQHGGGSHD